MHFALALLAALNFSSIPWDANTDAVVKQLKEAGFTQVKPASFSDLTTASVLASQGMLEKLSAARSAREIGRAHV